MTKHSQHAHDHRHDHHHDPSHGHGGGHGGGHVHAPADFGRAFAIGIALNTAFVGIEAGYGWWSNSVALLADAGHNLSDVLGLVVAWVAAVLGRRPATERYTYGLRSASILAALFNAILLLVAVAAIVFEAASRLAHPEPVAGATVMAVAAVGIVVNGFTAWLFASGRGGDINIRGAYLHMAADAAVSAGVVAAGLAIVATGWLWLDPLVSFAIAGVILWSTWDLLRQSLAMALGAAPQGLDTQAIRSHLEAQSGVAGVHDLHIWALSTTETALTAHLVMPDGHPGDGFVHGLADALRRSHGIGHVTLQVERDAASCPRAAAAAG
jgi:cobalt-zinc-cadmium efflux system protein